MAAHMTKMSTSDLSRQACRLGGGYIIDRIRSVSDVLDQNFVSTLVFLAIVRANVGGITDSREIALRHLALGETPQDAHRLPVSTYALARDLGIPYETVRRHVRKLKTAGLCVTVAKGAIVPTRVLIAAAARNAALSNQQAVQDLVDAAATCGIVGFAPSQVTQSDAPLQVARLSTDYFVDAMGILTQAADLDVITTLVMQTIGQMNTREVRLDSKLGREFGGIDDIPPDDMRCAVSAYAVSKALRLPYETTRRTVIWLEERDLVRRDETGGLIVPAAYFQRADVMQGFTRFGRLTMTFLDRLAEYGVTARQTPSRRGRQARSQAQLTGSIAT
jgi:hypothetical protein